MDSTEKQVQAIFWGIMTALVVFFLLCIQAKGEVGSLPPLEIARGLPSHQMCLEASEAAQLYWRAYETDESCRRYTIWHLCWEITNTDLTEHQRRTSLRNLINLTSWREVLTGQLPPPIPWEK